MHRYSLSIVAVLLATACSACMMTAGVPFAVDAPAQALDLDAARLELEAGICADLESPSCRVLRALDEHDGEASSPPALPAEMPRQIEVRIDDAGPELVDVGEWLLAQFGEHGLLPAQRFPLGAGAAGAALDGLERATLSDAALEVSDNSIVLDLPPFELWAGPAGSDTSVDDDIAAGQLTRIAVLPAIDAGFDGTLPLTFSDGGADLLLAAVRDGGSLALRADPTVPLALAEGTAPDLWQSPGGSASLTLSVTGAVAIPLRELVDAAP